MDNLLFSSNLDVLKQSSNNIILFGEVGSGKTTIINTLCSKKYETKEGGYSCTKEIQYAYTEDGSIIIDFPGLNASEDIIKHLQIQKFTLSVIPIKMICFVIKSNTRIDNILKTTYEMLKIFYKNIKNIVIILTFSERLSDQNKKDIKLQINKKYKIDENLIIFSYKNINSKELYQNICLIKQNLSNISLLKLNEKNLLNSELNEDILEYKESKMEEYKKMIISLNQTININKDGNKMIALYFTFKYYIFDLIKKLREKLEKKIADIDTINAETMVFSNELYEQLNTITNKYNILLKFKNNNIYEFGNFGKMSGELEQGINNRNISSLNIIFGKFQIYKIFIIINFNDFDINIINDDNNNIIINGNNNIKDNVKQQNIQRYIDTNNNIYFHSGTTNEKTNKSLIPLYNFSDKKGNKKNRTKSTGTVNFKSNFSINDSSNLTIIKNLIKDFEKYHNYLNFK